MPHFFPNYDVISKKKKKRKGLHRNSNVFFGRNLVISKKKVFRPHMLISQCHFDGPSAGPAEANGLMGPLKSMGPGALYPPAPLSRWPCALSLVELMKTV